MTVNERNAARARAILLEELEAWGVRGDAARAALPAGLTLAQQAGPARTWPEPANAVESAAQAVGYALLRIAHELAVPVTDIHQQGAADLVRAALR